MRVFGELRRRNVFKASVAYTILAWLLVKLVDVLSPAINPGDRALQILGLIFILGFPIVVLFAWAYEITPEGIRPTSHVDKSKSITTETGRKLNFILLTLLAIASVVLLAENLL